MARLVLFLVALLCATASAKKLPVELYVEALCPYCVRLLGYVRPVVDSGLADEMDFKIYYAGNAKLKGNTLECQHGEFECYLNKVLGCAMDGKQLETWFPFVECLEGAAGEATYKASMIPQCALLARLGSRAVHECAYRHADFPSIAQTCAEKSGYDAEALESCANGERGEKLHMAAYLAVKALDPPHRWVPWMVVDGMPVYDAAYHLTTILCLHMEASERPELCYQQESARGMANDVQAGCLVDEPPTETVY